MIYRQYIHIIITILQFVGIHPIAPLFKVYTANLKRTHNRILHKFTVSQKYLRAYTTVT